MLERKVNVYNIHLDGYVWRLDFMFLLRNDNKGFLDIVYNSSFEAAALGPLDYPNRGARPHTLS